MRYKVTSQKDYIGAVRQKVDHAKEALMFGALGPARGRLRDADGFDWSKANFVNIAKNLYNNTNGGRDTVAAAIMNNFSSAGFVDVANVVTVGAIDVSIRQAAYSLIPYAAVDRAMKAPVDTIYFMNLVAMNDHGDVTAGEVVAPNFRPLTGKTTFSSNKLSQEITSEGSGELPFDFTTFIVPGTVVVTVTDDEGTVLFKGKDYEKNGTIVLPGSTGTNTVDYQTGVVTLNDVAAGKVTVTARADMTSDSSGDAAQQVKPQFEHAHIVTKEKTLIYKQSSFAMAYMANIAQTAGKNGTNADYSRNAFDKIMNLYTEDLNKELIEMLFTMAEDAPDTQTLDLSTYNTPTSNFSQTKDDLINLFFINMKSAFIKKSNLAPTVCITGTKGAALLESSQQNWQVAPSFYDVENGLAGTFKGTPVFRHIYVDKLEGDAGVGETESWFVMACKRPGNDSGSVVYGEYLPLVRSATFGNFMNGTQESTTFWGMNGFAPIQKHLIVKGIIKSPTQTTSEENPD